MLFTDADAAAGLFRSIRWANGPICQRCRESNVTRYCKYKGNIQRYMCKDCNTAFNDKTGTTSHYKHISMGKWMPSVWMYLCGPLNGISIHYISESIGRTYRYAYYMMRGIMDHMQCIQEKVLSVERETVEMYMRAASEGVPLETNGEDGTIPGRRALPGGPGRGTFEKNTPVISAYHRRVTGDEHDCTIFDVPRDEKSLWRWSKTGSKRISRS